MHEIAQKQDLVALVSHLSARACLGHALTNRAPFANYPFSSSHSHSDAIKIEAKRDGWRWTDSVASRAQNASSSHASLLARPLRDSIHIWRRQDRWILWPPPRALSNKYLYCSIKLRYHVLNPQSNEFMCILSTQIRFNPPPLSVQTRTSLMESLLRDTSHL